jgi:hypothetical protein
MGATAPSWIGGRAALRDVSDPIGRLIDLNLILVAHQAFFSSECCPTRSTDRRKPGTGVWTTGKIELG